MGPNLEDVVKKYKGDAKAVLHEILEPSRNIEEKYRTISPALDDGTIVTGNVISEDQKTMVLYTAAPVPKEHKIAKESIDSRLPSALSIMPAGQLNTLEREQILDLIAFLAATGDSEHAAFRK